MHKHGFTLIELIISMTLLALLIGGGLAAMTAGTRASAKADHYNTMISRGQGALQLMTRDIRTALEHDDFFLVSLDNQHEGKDADTIDFIAAGMPRIKLEEEEEYPVVIGRCEVGYYIENDPDTEQQWLVRREDSSLDDDELEGGSLTLVGPYVASLNIEFYDGLDWQDGWDQLEDDFPKAIRIEIIVVDEDERENPIALQSTVTVMTRNDEQEELQT